MSAHPIRALHERLLAAAVSLDATAPSGPGSSYDRVHADGELSAGLTGLDGLIESLNAMAWHVERAVERGAGQSYDLDKLQRLSERLAETHRKVEISAGRLTGKLARPR